MGSKYNDGHLSLSACANYCLEDESEARGEGLAVSYRMNGGGFNREINSSSCGSIIGKCDRTMMEGHLQSSQQGSQRSVRLQSVPPLPLFSRLKPDPSIPFSNRVEESESLPPLKKPQCPLQSKIADLINLCKTNILGSGPAASSQRCLTSPHNNTQNTHSNTHNNNGELLQISDEEMLNFPKLFTDAFNIGDYEGVSKVNKYFKGLGVWESLYSISV